MAEIADLDLPVPAPDGVRLSVVDDADGVATMLRVHDEVFGSGPRTRRWSRRCGRR